MASEWVSNTPHEARLRERIAELEAEKARLTSGVEEWLERYRRVNNWAQDLACRVRMMESELRHLQVSLAMTPYDHLSQRITNVLQGAAERENRVERESK